MMAIPMVSGIDQNAGFKASSGTKRTAPKAKKAV
jgi:hypothetical protein